MVFLLIGCSNHNDLMTRLINERKQYSDSLVIYKETSARLQDRAEMKIDSSDFKKMLDTARMANDGISIAEEKIKGLTFSIDSLGKMK